LPGTTNPPRLNIQENPISRETKLATSLAPAARAAARSVVNIYSSKEVRERSWSFFDDTRFRRFFGNRDFTSPIPRERRAQSLGSGVIVSTDGYLLSNHHVIEDADDIRVALPDGKEFAAKVVGTDPQTEIAVLKIDASSLTAITITDSDKLEVGDAVLALGNPFGVGQTVTVGHVSGVGRGGIGIADYEDFIQTDAAINPGNSGGALVDAEGRLVGINTAIITRSGGNQGIGFAIPSNLARVIMERLIREGKIVRGYLGVMIQPVTEELAHEFKLADSGGALVGEVTRRSPAADAGLKEGDVIIAFNNTKVVDSRHLRLMVSQTAPGTKVTIKVIREGKEQSLTAKLDELRTDGVSRTARSEGRRWGRAGAEVFDGVALDDLDTRTRREYRIPNTVRGAMITDVDPASRAAEAGLRPGDVIQEIDRQPVGGADEAIDLSRRTLARGVLLRVWSNGSSRYLVLPPTRGKQVP